MVWQLPAIAIFVLWCTGPDWTIQRVNLDHETRH
jgi:hypothetical protein